MPRPKGRSASICATTAIGVEAIQKGATSGTPQSRRRKPATRSQSARITNGKSVRRRIQATTSPTLNATHCSSEPKLNDQDGTPVVSPLSRRKGSQRRGTSVYHRKSAAFLDVPEFRPQPTTPEPEDEDSYRLRSFSFNTKGKGIINRGDSFRRRRSRSNSLCPPNTTEGPSSPLIDSNNHHAEIKTYIVSLLGTSGVGKTALIRQFMTSECINAYEKQHDGISGCEKVSIMLNGEESELYFKNVTSYKDIDRTNCPDAFLVLYSVVDKASFLKAEIELAGLQDADLSECKPIILVANKIDLARSRTVSTQDGKCLACTFRAKYIELSVGINHNVDELLVGVLTQIRLKVLYNEEHGPSSQWYKKRGVQKASMKARQMFTWLFGKEDSKFRNCENLHIL